MARRVSLLSLQSVSRLCYNAYEALREWYDATDPREGRRLRDTRAGPIRDNPIRQDMYMEGMCMCFTMSLHTCTYLPTGPCACLDSSSLLALLLDPPTSLSISPKPWIVPGPFAAWLNKYV